MPKKINNIKMPIDGTVTTLDIEDKAAIHVLNTYNGGKVFGSKSDTASASDISLADTPITEDEINNLFA